MSFHERLRVAKEFEKSVMDRVSQSAGWICFTFGQANLPENARSRLMLSHSLIRWMPDLIAAHDGGKLILLDAKCCRTDTQNWDIEISSIYALTMHVQFYEIPGYFVFPDFSVMTPRTARMKSMNGLTTDNGSGTPYVLVPKSASNKTLDDILII